MDGRRLINDEMGDQIKKGPWKAEEDQVLINHVKKYGPRDWSSIRSKGLLLRTGKSCRLRWVNKLRPNLKNGVKFSAEEERTVIDLQAQFGNKWAKIATFLHGRTDNDVKNFWSSRQKRLARIMHTASSSSSNSSSSNNNHKSRKPTKHHRHVLAVNDVPYVEDTCQAEKFCSSSEGELLSKSQYCSSSYIDNSENIKMVPLPELIQHANSLYYEQQTEFIPPIDKKPYNGIDQTPLLTHFPSFPQVLPLESDFTLTFDDNQAMIAGFEDSNSLAALGHTNYSELAQTQLPIMSTCFGTEGVSSEFLGKMEENDNNNNNNNHVTPDSLMDEFPIDMFDHIDSLPSPSDW